MVCVVELDTVTVDEADSCVRTEGWDGELFQEISSNLKVCILLTFGFACLGSPFRDLTAGTGRSRLVVHLLRLPIGFE